MNLNGEIDWSDADRIVSNDTRYVSLDGDWWRESSSWQTRQNGSPTLTRVGLTRTRLTGLGRARTPAAPQGILTSESRSFDPLGNESVSCSYLDRSSRTTTRTTTSPASSLAAQTVVQSGLTLSSRSPTGVTMTYAYDALGRQISQTDGRGNTSQIVYDAQGRVATMPVPAAEEGENLHSGWDLEYERGFFGDITVFTTDPVFVELWTEANKIYTYKAKDTLTVSVSAGKSVSAGGALDIVKGKYYTIFGTLHVGILIEDRYRKWRCACKSRMPVGAAVRGGWLSVKRTTDWSREYLDPSITVVGKWDDEVEVYEGIETIGIGGGGVSVGVGGASGSVTYNTD